jgi:protein CpxP
MHTKTISTLLGALLSTGVVLAQAPDQAQPSTTPTPQATQNEHTHSHHAPDPDKQAKHLGKKLGLSSDQVAQIKPILEDRAQQMQALHADATLSQQDRHTKAQGIMQDSKTKIEAVLNDTQKQQFEQMLQEHRAHHHMQPQGQ